jgi:hypothetical protein
MIFIFLSRKNKKQLLGWGLQHRITAYHPVRIDCPEQYRVNWLTTLLEELRCVEMPNTTFAALILV